MSDFLAMGGYATFVWASYALSAAVLLGLTLSSLRRLKALEAELAEFENEGGA
jgi:heme exporter protein D